MAKPAEPRPRDEKRDETLGAIRAAMESRDFEGAAHLAQALLDADPVDAAALALLAWATVRGGDATEDELRAALDTMERAVSLDRTSDHAVFHRGLVHKQLGNVPSAFRDFARAMQINPQHPDAEREVRIFAMRARKGRSGEHQAVVVKPKR